MLTPKEQLYEIDSLIAANVSQIKHLRNLLNDPALAARLIAEQRASIQKLSARIAEIEHTQMHGWEMLDQHKVRVEQLQKERASVVNAVGIEKIKAMFLEMQKLESGTENGPLNIAEIVEEIENENEESEGNHDQLDEPNDS